MRINLLEGERLDDLQRNGYQIIQHSGKFCFGMDAVLLSGFVKIKPGETVVDLGTGTGIIPILLEGKTKASHLTGIEIQEESADMARRSVSLNQLEDKITIMTGDIKDASQRLGVSSFDVVTSNPPYKAAQHGIVSGADAMAIARHEILCTLEDVIREASCLLKEKGRFYLVHRPSRIPEIMNLMQKYRLEPKRMKLVYPYVNKRPNMVLIEASLGGNPELTVEEPLIVYQSPGKYTDEIYDIYGY